MKLLFSLFFLYLSLSAYSIKNGDDNVIVYIGGENNDRVSINCGEEVDEDYALKICGKVLADDFVKDTIILDFKDSDDSLEGDEEDANHKVTITLELNKASAEDVTFDFETKEDSADDGDDYTGVSDTFTIAAGETSIDIEVEIVGDSTEEKDESFDIEISNVKNADLADATATYTINNDDSTPTLTIESSKTVTETASDQTIQMRVSLSETLSDDVTFDLKTADGSGDAGGVADEDYTAIDDSFTIKAGDSYIDIDLTIKGDDLYELSDLFSATISNPSDNAIVDSDNDTCDITIDNDDDKPLIKVKEDVSADEGTDPNFTVELSTQSGVNTYFHITMSHTDTEDADFEGDSPLDADFTLAKGDTSVDVKVDVNDDDSDEDNEDYSFKITDATNADIDTDNNEKTGTIEDNDSSGWYSDRRLKTDIRKIDSSLESIDTLHGVKFYWKDRKKFGTQEEIGLIAQDVEKVYPQVVLTGENGYKKVKYQLLIAPLIEAIKELKKENEKLRERVEKLENAH